MVPSPCRLATSTVPSFNSTLRLAMAIPRPVPVTRVEKYGSKILASAASSRPTPVSRIASVTARASAVASSVSSPPPGIACRAFSTTLVIARPTSVGSTERGGSVGGTATTRRMRSSRPIR